MAFVDHIRELRRRIIIALAAIMVGTIVGFVWYGYAPFGLEPLGEILRGPYCSLPSNLRADITRDGQCRLLATAPFEMFLLRLKVGAIAGVVLASPVWLSEIWLFITPGLHKKERRISMVFLTLAIVFFLSGAVLAYFVLDVGLAFLLSIGNDVQVAALSGHDYYDLVQSFLLIFGVCFEVPLIIAMLNMVGILHYRFVKGKRRIIWVVIFFFGAVLSPGGEVTGMLALSLTVGTLIELAFLFCKINDKRRERQNGRAQLDDDASAFHYTPEPIAAATGLEDNASTGRAPGQPPGSSPVAASPRPTASPREAASPAPTASPVSRPSPLDYTTQGLDDVL